MCNVVYYRMTIWIVLLAGIIVCTVEYVDIYLVIKLKLRGVG